MERQAEQSVRAALAVNLGGEIEKKFLGISVGVLSDAPDLTRLMNRQEIVLPPRNLAEPNQPQPDITWLFPDRRR